MKIILGFGQDSKILYKQLKDRGENVKVLTSIRQTPLEWQNLINITPSDFEYIDLLDFYDLYSIINKYNTSISEIYNFAAISFTRHPYRQSWQLMKNNYLILDNLLSSIKLSRLNIKIIHPLSSEMYEGGKEAIDETTPFSPSNFYALSKVNEHSLIKLHRKLGNNIICPIFFNHESIFRGRQFFTYKVLVNIVKKQFPITLFNPSQVKDWGYAPEFMAGLIDLTTKTESGDFVFGTGTSYKVIDFVIDTLKLAGYSNLQLNQRDENLEILNSDNLLITFREINAMQPERIANPQHLFKFLGHSFEFSGKKLANQLFSDYSNNIDNI